LYRTQAKNTKASRELGTQRKVLEDVEQNHPSGAEALPWFVVLVGTAEAMP
jgi:hypothetical protein